jgi:serine-type D-Ala-D-Ala carboxypeptidase
LRQVAYTDHRQRGGEGAHFHLANMTSISQHSFEVLGQGPPSVVRCERGFSAQEAVTVLLQGIEGRAFPGASFAVFKDDRIVMQAALGRFTYEGSSPAIELPTVFDLASLTKVVATTAMAMLRYDRGALVLEQPVIDLLPEFAGKEEKDERRQQVTIEMLLSHSSGLPAYVPLYKQARNRAALVQLAAQTPLEADPGTHAVYSDIGFILLAELLQGLAGTSLDDFCAKQIFVPLRVSSARFCPAEEDRSLIPPTLDDKSFRHRIIQGEVHDENASAMDGVAGHAGIFAASDDLMKFAACILGFGPQLFRPETIQLFTRRRPSPIGTSRALGWDTPSTPSQSGRYFSPHSFGHLGYTGTSLWIDGEQSIAIALLTNRTWPDNQSQIVKQIRPMFHDAVMEALTRK